jgi:mono/diheme cytochrome c family protein
MLSANGRLRLMRTEKAVRLSIVLVVTATAVTGAGGAKAASSAVFVTNCAVCHQSDGRGVPGLYPPLANSVGNYLRVNKGRAYLIQVVSFGMSGSLVSHGQSYSGYMPSWPQLNDQEIADALNEVLTRFNGGLLPKDFSRFTANEVKGVRAKQLSSTDVLKERQELMKELDQAGAAK